MTNVFKVWMKLIWQINVTNVLSIKCKSEIDPLRSLLLILSNIFTISPKAGQNWTNHTPGHLLIWDAGFKLQWEIVVFYLGDKPVDWLSDWTASTLGKSEAVCSLIHKCTILPYFQQTEEFNSLQSTFNCGLWLIMRIHIYCIGIFV